MPTNNHGLNTPSEGQTDWDVPMNENFEFIDTDVPVVDTGANMAQYTPKQNALFIARDTGERFFGDGSQWNILPAGSTSTQSAPTTAQALVDSTPTMIVRKSSGTTELVDNSSGNTIASGSAETIFDRIVNELQDGDHVHIEPGTYETNGNHEFVGLYTDVTWTSDAHVKLTQNSSDTELFLFKDFANFTMLGGVYDGNQENTGNCTGFGCSGVLRLTRHDNLDAGYMWLMNGNRWAVNLINADNSRLHHCYFSHTNERGIYPKGGENTEVDHNAYINIERGAFRIKNDPIGYHVHDNLYVMGQGHPYAYIIRNGARDFVLERETVINFGSYGMLDMARTGETGIPVHNITFRDCYYHGHPDNGQNFDSIGDGVDVDSLTFDNVTVENLTFDNQQIADKVNS